MRQEDYLLREIEKIGLILNAIRNKIFGGKDSLAITREKQISDVKGMLWEQIKFDLEKLLDLNAEQLHKYISDFEGFNVRNVEALAEVVAQMGFVEETENSKKYFEKALQLYELCNQKDKTYSLERETNINRIKDAQKLKK